MPGTTPEPHPTPEDGPAAPEDGLAASEDRPAAPEIHPLTPERWDDLATLFGARGACGGCWCMTWRLQHAEYEANKGDGNRRAFRERVEEGPPPGLLAYVDGHPVGWCAVAPREEYPRLARSRILAPVDDQPVWSVVCFFVEKTHRGRGLSVALLNAAAAWARGRGARILEGYPVEPALEETEETEQTALEETKETADEKPAADGDEPDAARKRIPPVFAFTGLASAFRAAGFREVERRSPTRPIMRREVGEAG